MIQNKFIQTFFLSFFFWVGLLLPGSCHTEDTGEYVPEEEQPPIRFELALPGTRVATDTDLVSCWEEGDEVGIFAAKSIQGVQNNLQASGNYLDNIKLTYTGGQWVSESPIYYPNDGEYISFYAYYPYDTSLTDPTSYDFEVAIMQEGTDYNTSDFLIAKTGLISKSNEPVQLSFKHQLAVIQVEVFREYSMPYLDGDFAVTLTSVQTGVTIDFNKPAGTFSLTGTVQDVGMHKTDTRGYIYRAVIPAQDLNQNTKITFIQTTNGKEINREYTALAGTVLTPGKAHKYKITLGYGVDPEHVYEIGDVYPHVGPVIGIVYEITNGGKNGKIISLDEVSGLQWANHTNDHGAADYTKGINNMYDIAQYINKTNYEWDDFPVFNWIHSKNDSHEDYSDPDAKGVWYLPAQSEGLVISARYNTYGQAAFNSKLIYAGGVALRNADYWLSTTYGTVYTFRLNMSGGNTMNNSQKTYTTYPARCILAF